MYPSETGDPRRSAIPSENFSIPQSLGLGLLLLLALGLRLYRLGCESLWYDETLSALFASQPLPVAIRSMLEEGLQHSPLYYLLLRPFYRLGFSEFNLRLLSVLLGVLGVFMLAHAGRVLVGPKVGLWAAAFLTIHPFHLWYSREARMYALLAAVSIGTMLYFSKNLFGRPTMGRWLAMAGFLAVGINSHHFAFFIPLIQLAFILVTFKRNYVFLRPWAGALILAGVTLLPWSWVVLQWGEFYLTSGIAHYPPGRYDIFKTFWNFSVGFTGRIDVLVALSLSLFLVLLVAALRSFSSRMLLTLLWFALPPLVTKALSLRLPMYMDRYLILSLPAFLLLIAMGIESLPDGALRKAMLILVLVALAFGAYRVYFDDDVYERADWRSLGAYLEDHVDPERDRMYAWYYQNLIPLHFYYHGPASVEPVVSFRSVNPPRLPDPMEEDSRTWLVISHPNPSAHLVGHCQPFDIEGTTSNPAALDWYRRHQHRLTDVVPFTCLRLEIYE